MEPTAPDQEPLLLKVDEAARLLCIGRTRVYDLIRSNDLRSVKIFGARRIPRTSLDSYVASLLEESEAA
ncbi:helix-turn-helix domain-containing protein [Amycolatopsis sp. lyj-108]|uniref:helix-turn-helix domain-containing protein n=1 Tax=Amycolatopsis sp. lyj-108 TaxID=2789286 RepID=UPI00397CC3F1